MGVVNGPGSSVVGNVVLWNDTTGTTVSDSGKTLSIGGLSDATYQTGGPSNLILGQNVTLAGGATQNVFIGEAAGATAAHSTSATQYNTAVGYSSMNALTSGAQNTALGATSLFALTTGSYNTALGQSALGSMTTGDGNIGIGKGALYSYATGSPSKNIAIGYVALTYATAGSSNIGIGFASGASLTTGSGNILIGDSRDVTGAAVNNTLNIGDVITATGMDVPSTSTVTVPGKLSVTGHTTFEGVTSTGATGTGKLVYDTSPTLTTAALGSSTATTQSAGDNSTKVATTAYVDAAAGAGVVYNAIAGCLPSSMAGTHTTATMTVSAGQAADSTNAVYINSAGYSWAVSNGNAINGYQGGTTLPNSSTIHMFLCTGASGTGTFASTSLTPTLPTGYAVSYRRIFSFNTKSTGAPIPYTAIEAEGGSLICWLATQVLDISTASLATGARTLFTLTVPKDIKVSPIIRAISNTSGGHVLLTSPDETDVTPAAGVTTVPQFDTNGATVALIAFPLLTTNTSSQIGAATSATAAFYATTRGFKDFRRG